MIEGIGRGTAIVIEETDTEGTEEDESAMTAAEENETVIPSAAIATETTDESAMTDAETATPKTALPRNQRPPNPYQHHPANL